MVDENSQREEQKPLKRFTSYEQFLKDCYPKSTQREEAQRKAEMDGQIGADLALDSLNRRASLLNF